MWADVMTVAHICKIKIASYRSVLHLYCGNQIYWHAQSQVSALSRLTNDTTVYDNKSQKINQLSILLTQQQLHLSNCYFHIMYFHPSHLLNSLPLCLESNDTSRLMKNLESLNLSFALSLMSISLFMFFSRMASSSSFLRCYFLAWF